MNPLHALILGIVEGLTEFLPVSSTGHLILVNRALGLHGEGVDTYSIVIQLGALLAAIAYYRRTLIGMTVGVLRGEAAALRLLVALGVASLPALGLGYLFGKRIKAVLFQPVYVAAALVIGGVVMLAIDRWQRGHASKDPAPDLSKLSLQQALLVGATQTAALWPGMSRSMSSIVGGQLAGLSNAAAADFAFLLAIPVLGAATVYDLLKNHAVLMRDTGGAALGVGLLTSFVVGFVVIKSFLRYLRRFGLAAFGYYRIALGAVVLAYAVTGM